MPPCIVLYLLGRAEEELVDEAWDVEHAGIPPAGIVARDFTPVNEVVAGYRCSGDALSSALDGRKR